MALDMYKIITDRILEDLKKGEIPWNKPWVNTNGNYVARSHENGRVYSLLNQMLVGMPGEYVTFNQAKKEGGTIKKNAKAKKVVFFKMLEKKDRESDDDDKWIPFLKYSNVFHLDDTEGVEHKYVFTDESMHNDNLNIEEIDKAVKDYVDREHVTIRNYEQNRSYYSPAEDEIILPQMFQFANSESYYATLFHEIGHSTGARNRLYRDFSGNFGTKAYSREELVAEITSAVLCNHFGIDTEKVQRNTSAYVQNWISVLENDTRAVVWAAGRAEKAVKLILNIKDEPVEADEKEGGN